MLICVHVCCEFSVRVQCIMCIACVAFGVFTLPSASLSVCLSVPGELSYLFRFGTSVLWCDGPLSFGVSCPLFPSQNTRMATFRVQSRELSYCCRTQ